MKSSHIAGYTLCITAFACSVQAQNFPTKPIRIVAPEVGGGGDFVARLIAAGLTERFGQSAIVDNRPSGVILGSIVSKAPPDGYTLLNYGSGLWIGSLLAKTPYDPVKDFAPVTLSQSSPTVLVVSASSPANSVKELIALAKSRPGQLNYGSVAFGSVTHLGAELFKSMAGVDITRVNYKGAGMALTDLITGQVQLMFAVASSAAPHVKSGKLRALAVTSLKPSVLAPGVPTMSNSGLPGFESVSMNGILAPAGTPPAIIALLNQEIVAVLNKPDVKEKFLASGVETVGSTPEAFAATIKSEVRKWGKIIKSAGITQE